MNEQEEERWKVIVTQIVHDYRARAVSSIINAILEDVLVRTHGQGRTTRNSVKWNALALTFLDTGRRYSSIRILRWLVAREQSSAATQNNYGVALLRGGFPQEAKHRFEIAHQLDMKRVGVEKAKRLPAYDNLSLLTEGAENEKPEKVRRTGTPSQHNIVFMDMVEFSRPEWYGTVQFEKMTFLTTTVRRLLTELGLDVNKIPMLPAGDGMALFLTNCEDALTLVSKLTKDLQEYNTTMERGMKLELRFGIHNGYSFEIPDLHGAGNRIGPAINKAKRIMDLGSACHILCTNDYRRNLTELYGSKYKSSFHDCGLYPVKHGGVIRVYSFYDGSVGNPACPPRTRSEK